MEKIQHYKVHGVLFTKLSSARRWEKVADFIQEFRTLEASTKDYHEKQLPEIMDRIGFKLHLATSGMEIATWPVWKQEFGLGDRVQRKATTPDAAAIKIYNSWKHWKTKAKKDLEIVALVRKHEMAKAAALAIEYYGKYQEPCDY